MKPEYIRVKDFNLVAELKRKGECYFKSTKKKIELSGGANNMIEISTEYYRLKPTERNCATCNYEAWSGKDISPCRECLPFHGAIGWMAKTEMSPKPQPTERECKFCGNMEKCKYKIAFSNECFEGHGFGYWKPIEPTKKSCDTCGRSYLPNLACGECCDPDYCHWIPKQPTERECKECEHYGHEDFEEPCSTCFEKCDYNNFEPKQPDKSDLMELLREMKRTAYSSWEKWIEINTELLEKIIERLDGRDTVVKPEEDQTTDALQETMEYAGGKADEEDINNLKGEMTCETCWIHGKCNYVPPENGTCKGWTPLKVPPLAPAMKKERERIQKLRVDN